MENINGSGTRSRGGSSRRVLFAEIVREKDFITPGTGTATKVSVGPVFRDVGPTVPAAHLREVGGTSTRRMEALLSWR